MKEIYYLRRSGGMNLLTIHPRPVGRAGWVNRVGASVTLTVPPIGSDTSERGEGGGGCERAHALGCCAL